jgi:hypothetical protein
MFSPSLPVSSQATTAVNPPPPPSDFPHPRAAYVVVYSERSDTSPNEVPYRTPVCFLHPVSVAHDDIILRTTNALRRLDMIPHDKCTLYTAVPRESAIVLMQAEHGVATSLNPKGARQARTIGWTDTLADANLLMRDEVVLDRRGNWVAASSWSWVANGDNARVAGFYHRRATGTILQHEIFQVEVKD